MLILLARLKLWSVRAQSSQQSLATRVLQSGLALRLMNARANVRPHASGGRRSRHSALQSNGLSLAGVSRHRPPMWSDFIEIAR